jgi:hypothetical protein
MKCKLDRKTKNQKKKNKKKEIQSKYNEEGEK